jgi:molybdate transport system substrate-binding protein
MKMKLFILSGGAAAGVVKGLQAEFEQSSGCEIHASFSAVGAMKDRLVSGDPCDLAIFTGALIHQLIASGHIVPGSAQSLGIIKTGIAVRSGDMHPDVSSGEALMAAFRQASAIFSPDTEKSTAGIHFMNVLKSLGIADELKDKFQTFPNGAEAMQAMVNSSSANPIACTQVTEILYTPGIDLVDVLPKEFELATNYTLGICTQARHPESARLFAQFLTGSASQALRKQGGFEVLAN